MGIDKRIGAKYFYILNTGVYNSSNRLNKQPSANQNYYSKLHVFFNLPTLF